MPQIADDVASWQIVRGMLESESPLGPKSAPRTHNRSPVLLTPE